MATESKVPKDAPPPPPAKKSTKFIRIAIYAYFSIVCGYFATNYIYGNVSPSGFVNNDSQDKDL